MKQFGKSALSPSYAREAHFKSSAPVSNHFTFDCFSCGRPISISYQLLIGAAGQWEATIGDELATAAKTSTRLVSLVSHKMVVGLQCSRSHAKAARPAT